jgi:hypothetical protein
MNYFLLYFSTLLIVFSTIGYGFLLSRIVNKELINFNLGYLGLLGLLCLTIISYTTIYFTAHNYTHNLIIHFIGICLFIYNIHTQKLNKEVLKLLILFSILFLGMLIIRNHDDFNYYHFTYSLGLTQDKLQLGLGNFQHGYKHHSSLFFFNSITYLPFIKFYLFHAVGWLTFLFTNFIILKFILNKKNIKEFNFNFVLYLVIFLFINVKFARIGGYGTDISGQLIMFILLPLIYSSLQKKEFKSNLDLSILLISYITTLKVFFILNFLFLFSYFFFINVKNLIKYFLNARSILVSFFTLLLLTSINISYTGCGIYPIKQTCFFDKISWAIDEKTVEHLSMWYNLWSKAGAGPTHGVDNPEIYIQKFNWVSNWYYLYFEYKGYETLLGIVVIFILLSVIFYSKNIKSPKKNDKKIISILYVLSFILLFEWFYNHPSLRYGGYYLFCFFFFIPFSYLISRYKLNYNRIKTSVFSLIVISFLVFNIKNISRINKEQDMFKNDKNNFFPLFYAPVQTFKTIELENNINVYFPTSGDGCYVTKTPCVGGADGIYTKKILGFDTFARIK